MTSDFTRKTSCASPVCVRTLRRVTLLDVAMNWMRKASTATAAWLSSVSTSRTLFQSKEPANTFLWISLTMKFQSLLYKACLRAAIRQPAVCQRLWKPWALSHLLCHIFFTQNTALYDICKGNKSLRQLHFKYYTQVEENVQQDKCLEVRDPLEGIVLYRLLSLWNMEPWCVCLLFCFLVQSHITSRFVIMWTILLGFFSCHFFFITPSWNVHVLREEREKNLSSFTGETIA